MVSSRSKTAAEAASQRRTTRAGAASRNLTVDASPLTVLKKTTTQSKKAPARTHAISPVSVSSPGRSRKRGTYCLCEKTDNGTPMVFCEGGCKNWYHFECVGLSEDHAGEIGIYICPNCEASSGLKTVMDYEGELVLPIALPQGSASPSPIRTLPEVPPDTDSPEATDDDGSEDDYVADKVSKKRSNRRLLSYVSDDKTQSDDDDDGSDGEAARPNKRISRGGAQGRLKRLKKASSPTTSGSAPKSNSGNVPRRRASEAANAQGSKQVSGQSGMEGDSTRRYIFGRLMNIIRSIFEEHAQQAEPAADDNPNLRESEEKGTENEGPGANDATTTQPNKELSDEEKTELEAKTKAFVTELESCMMDTYGEPDKTGKTHAGQKYKERFRTLEYNLPKRDRIELRRGIALGTIPPSQLNVMSSTDLADEQTKHNIEVLEKEALEHSILQKVTAPRAKITHKGYEAIEDVTGTRTTDAAREEEEQRMAMEKRERERLARLRAVSQSGQEGSPITPVDPSINPTSPTSPSWGAPPPNPGEIAQSPIVADHPAMASRLPPRPLFVPSASDFTSGDQGLDLADLIHIDEDMPPQDAPPSSNPQERMSEQIVANTSTDIPTPVIASGPSPFAPAKPVESPMQTSFDLNALWTEPGRSEQPNETSEVNVESPIEQEGDGAEKHDDGLDEAMDLGSDNDQDLDAMLDRAEQADKQSASSDVTALPIIWEGQILMPLEASNNLTPDVDCRQIGGQELAPMSGYWQTLFPSSTTRIDGRVPTTTSNQYLVNSRLNTSKEIILVYFSPKDEQARVDYDKLIQYLLGKDRHALVFPWGVHPKPTAPGRELYLVPLLKEGPIPEFLELMDGHRLPEKRTSDIMLGVFILNKGKLSPSPIPSQPSISTSTGPSAAAITYGPGGLPATPPLPVSTTASNAANVATVQNLLASLPGGGNTVPNSSNPTLQLAQGLQINKEALAEEVANLTPEQVLVVMQHLRTVAGGSGVAAVPPAQAPMSYPPHPMPNFPPQIPPSYGPHMHDQTQNQYFSQSPSEEHGYSDRDGSYYNGGDRERRKGRPGRPPRPRRGRGGRPPNDNDMRDNSGRHADQGWGGRGRPR